MTTENQQNQQQQRITHPATTFGYGDVVLYSQNGKICNALVMQSQVVPIPAPGGLRNEEHLELRYLNPSAGKQVMSQIEMDNAISRAFGVRELSEENKTGWLRAKITVDPENLQGETSQEQQYAGHHAQTG